MLNFGWKKPEDKFSRIRDDLNTVKMAENYSPNPQDILNAPLITLKEYRCVKCHGDTFNLIAMPILALGMGKTMQFRCNRCRTLVNSGVVKEYLNSVLNPRLGAI